MEDFLELLDKIENEKVAKIQAIAEAAEQKRDSLFVNLEATIDVRTKKNWAVSGQVITGEASEPVFPATKKNFLYGNFKVDADSFKIVANNFKHIGYLSADAAQSLKDVTYYDEYKETDLIQKYFDAKKAPVVAEPGVSNHGSGMAVDVPASSWGNYNSKQVIKQINDWKDKAWGYVPTTEPEIYMPDGKKFTGQELYEAQKVYQYQLYDGATPEQALASKNKYLDSILKKNTPFDSGYIDYEADQLYPGGLGWFNANDLHVTDTVPVLFIGGTQNGKKKNYPYQYLEPILTFLTNPNFGVVSYKETDTYAPVGYDEEHYKLTIHTKKEPDKYWKEGETLRAYSYNYSHSTSHN